MELNKKFGAIILAAGYSSRMNAFKPLLPLGDKKIVNVVIDTAKSAGIAEIVVVTGYNFKELEAECENTKTVYNEAFDEGMFTSIQKGLGAISEDLEGCFIMPVDCPLVGVDALKKIMDVGGNEFAVPTYMGKKGHPLFVPKNHIKEILNYDGKSGLKGITDKYFEEMKRIPVDCEGIVLDMDDQNAYEKIKKYKAEGSGLALRELVKGRRILLIRHGQIRQHKEKIFLGQTDEPLSLEGIKQTEKAKQLLKTKHLKTNRIYSSDLKRAMETAEAFGFSETICIPELREMSLGDWDGRFISDIKKEFPKEYEMRGRNIFTYKTGNHSENFYDLQYRVLEAMKKILKCDKNKDVVIVAHKGVIRVIHNNLNGKGVEENWNGIENCQILEQIF